MLVAAFATISASMLFGQKSDDRKAILGMCGCFEVTFEYAETFRRDTAYKFQKPYKASGLEWVTPVENSSEKLVLQHILAVNDSMVIKHWRQDWLFEHENLLVFEKNATWHREKLPAKSVRGQWAQQVFEVNDGPRYEQTGSWAHLDGRHFWETTADAPLPRRKYTKRSDYNVMRRTNRHEVFDWGWLHEQNNLKIMRSDDGRDSVLVEEKGRNSYRKTDPSRCRVAEKWWAAHQPFWAKVRSAWAAEFAARSRFALKSEVGGRYLAQEMDKLDREKGASASDAEIRAMLKSFFENETRRTD